ncbi:hypothetical protein RB195_025505 [Necator americanus]|uniref:Low-density lipoprotein receptor domain class A n=1 Tax=Necator americanus TaxID=51031 RepID=A0ABR1ESN9_NECAM
MYITSRHLFIGLSISFLIQGCWSITAVDVYRRLLEKERNIDDTFAFNLIRPIGSVGGELIWPRSYDSSNELTFDENGAAFPLHERPTLSRILRRSRISSLNGNNAYKDSYNYYNTFNTVAVRLPGRCLPGDFDCGFGRCVPVKVFHDGKPDCYDGSDEWCFFGHIKCGAYCVDMSHALSCLFSSKCDDSSRQPQWCSLSKEKLCGDPSSFPCKGYGECVLWEWLLDGKKDCIDGSDEDQSYVRTLETSFRCYYNRTKKVAMPTPLNYTQAFLRITNPMLPGFRPPPPPPQFPTLFPPVLSHTPPPIHITPPPTITLPPPVQLSRITGLPPLPPPYPTLLLTPPPSNPIPLPITSRPHSLLYSTTVGTVYVPEISTTPNDPFVSPNSVMTTGITPIHPIDSGYSLSGQGLQTLSSATSAPVFSTIQSSTPSEQTMSPSTKKRGFGHVRGRGRTTTTTPSVGTTAKITHIKVGIVDVKEGNKTGKQELDMITNNNDVLEIFGNNVGIEEEDSNGRTIPLSHVDLSSKENEAGLVTFPHASPSDVTVSSRTSNYDIDLTQDVYGNLNPKFQATKHPLTGHSIADDRIQSAKSSSSEMGVVHVTTESHLSMKNSSTDAAKNKTVLPPASGDVVQTAGRAAEDVSSSVSTGGVEASVQNKCLADLVDNSKKKYSNYKCECPTGEWAVGRKCEAHEADMAFYKLDIHSACGENKLTTEQKKWIAIGKIAENLKIPSCARTTSAGNVIVNSFCGNHCTLKDFGDLTRESASDTRKVTIEEAPLCEDSSTNYCHRYAICTVEDVHLKCVCKKGTNDTSNGLGRICEGVPGDDDCIMILGACLIFWLIILLGLLLLVPLLIFLLSHCCPGRGNLIHPKKDGLNLHGKGSGTRSGAQESKHIAAIMSSLLEKNAGGTREMAMKMALAELKKREQEVEKTTTVPAQPKMARLEDAHAVSIGQGARTSGCLTGQGLGSEVDMGPFPKPGPQVAASGRRDSQLFVVVEEVNGGKSLFSDCGGQPRRVWTPALNI